MEPHSGGVDENPVGGGSERMKGVNMRFTIFGMLGILLWGIALDGAEKNTTIGNPYGICALLTRW